MSYCTQTDLEKCFSGSQFVQLADGDGDGIADPEVVAEAIAAADAEIDGYLASRYTVPVSPVPALVRNLSVAIALWKMYGIRSLSNDRRRQDYEDAIRKLEALARGTMALPGASGGTVEADAEGGPEATRVADDRVFTVGRSSTGDVGTLDSY